MSTRPVWRLLALLIHIMQNTAVATTFGYSYLTISIPNSKWKQRTKQTLMLLKHACEMFTYYLLKILLASRTSRYKKPVARWKIQSPWWAGEWPNRNTALNVSPCNFFRTNLQLDRAHLQERDQNRAVHPTHPQVLQAKRHVPVPLHITAHEMDQWKNEVPTDIPAPDQGNFVHRKNTGFKCCWSCNLKITWYTNYSMNFGNEVGSTGILL